MTRVNGIPISVPAEYVGILPQGDENSTFNFESDTFRGLMCTIQPGATVVDVGASYGVLTVLMAKLVGPNGVVYSIEPNEESQSMAQRLARANGCEGRIHFVSALVGAREESNVVFWRVPGLESVASTRNADIKCFHENAERLLMNMVSVDGLAVKGAQVVKIDVEGSECEVVRGAERLLREEKPHLIIETHGLEIIGISGSVLKLCEMLAEFGYDFWDLHGNTRTSVLAYSERYSTSIGTLLASARLDADLVKRLETTSL